MVDNQEIRDRIAANKELMKTRVLLGGDVTEKQLEKKANDMPPALSDNGYTNELKCWFVQQYGIQISNHRKFI
jgi:hypothetical protein